MDELTRQSTAPVSSGRRRLNNIILGVAGVLVALLSGALIYLLYNQINENDSTWPSEQAMLKQTTTSQMASFSLGQSPNMTAASSVTTVAKKQPSTPNLQSMSSATPESSQSSTESTEVVSSSMPEITTEQTSQGVTTTCETVSSGSPFDCSETGSCGGVFHIYPYGVGNGSVPVYCECYGEEEVWTVIQRRIDGSVDFNRTWTDYKNGFGDACGEYWLGNEALHQLTATKSFKLYIILTGWDDFTKYAIYSTFSVADEVSGYRMDVGSYTGNAGNSMIIHNGYKFSTKDVDNDVNGEKNLAVYHSGPWWHCDGLQSNLNGLYYPSGDTPHHNGIVWSSINGYTPLKETTMMLGG